jgi:hypothetical protein
LTFDDGHLGNIDLLPVFRRIPGITTLFVCGTIASTRALWFEHAAAPATFRSLPDRERRHRLEHVLRADALSSPDTISAEQLAVLAKVCDVQAHTETHPCL